MVRSGVAFFYNQQALTGKIFAFVAEGDLLPGQLSTEAFLVHTAPSPGSAAGTVRLGRVEHPAAKVAVHATGGY